MTKNPIFNNSRNLFARRVLGFPAVRHAMAEWLSETFFGYQNSALNNGSADGLKGPTSGVRILDEKPFGAGDAPRFVLMAKDEAEAKLLVNRYSFDPRASRRALWRTGRPANGGLRCFARLRWSSAEGARTQSADLHRQGLRSKLR
jgi:hypothetical protein